MKRALFPICSIFLVCLSGCVNSDENDEPVLSVNFAEVNLCSKQVGQTHTWQNLQMVNTGESDLTIANIELRGDTNCAFKCFREPADTEPTNQFYQCGYEHENSAPFQMTVRPGQTRILKIEYTPSQAGVSDKATIAITSNAENCSVNCEAVDGTEEDYTWQRRLIPMCGTGIDSELTGEEECADAGCGEPLTADAPGCGET